MSATGQGGNDNRDRGECKNRLVFHRPFVGTRRLRRLRNGAVARLANGAGMVERDLRQTPPRRWNAAVEDILWLPRLVDKTRAAASGALGDYLYGQSPVDRALLRALGLSYARFTQIVLDSRTDGEVLARIADLQPDAPERARRWSRWARRNPGMRLFFLALDLDDGYIGIGRPLKTLVNAVSNPFARWLKRRFPENTGT